MESHARGFSGLTGSSSANCGFTSNSTAAVTVSAKLRVAVKLPPSVTVTVIVLVPLALAIGLSVIVRLAPLPPSAMPPAATTPTFDDVAVTVSDPAAVSTSPTVNAMAPVAVSSNVV